MLRGSSLFNMDYVVNEVWRTQRPLHTERILESAIELHCTATDVETAEIVDLTDLRDDAEIRTAMLASARLPWLAGAPVPFRGRLLFDATLAESVPVHVPRQTATDMLVLQTRPQGTAHAGLSSTVAQPHRPLPRQVQPCAGGAAAHALGAATTHWSVSSHASPRIPTRGHAVCRRSALPLGSPVISQMENRAAAMSSAAGHGFRAAWMALDGSRPGSGQRPARVPLTPDRSVSDRTRSMDDRSGSNM